MTTTSHEKHDKTDWNIYNGKKENHFTPLVVHIINEHLIRLKQLY